MNQDSNLGEQIKDSHVNLQTVLGSEQEDRE